MLAWLRYHQLAVIAVFFNTHIEAYQAIKFDYELGLRWCVDLVGVDSAITLMRTFENLTGWKLSPRTEYWRNMPPEMALILNSRGVDAILPTEPVPTSITSEENSI